MKCFLRKVTEGQTDADAHRYFVRFGKGVYSRRFLLSYERGKKLKVRASFELANDLVRWAHEHGVKSFSGRVFAKEKVAGREGRKKGGVLMYEISNEDITEFNNPYFTLLDAQSGNIVLKIKKALPKPGKDEEKIDDRFCVLETDESNWSSLKEAFFWDVPEGKKATVEHELRITSIILPPAEKDPVKIREHAKRKGTMVRKITVDEKETTREYPLEA